MRWISYALGMPLTADLSGDMPPNMAPMGEYQHQSADRKAYEVVEDDSLGAPNDGKYPSLAGSDILGAWAQGGTIVTPPTAEWRSLRPYGNDNGKATGMLIAAHASGWAVREIENGKPYPADDEPFRIEVRHKEYTGTWAGWGWRAEMLNVTTRDVAARAIGRYNDAECTQYWYTTGAFTLQDSEWYTDDQGNPIQVYATEYNEAELGQPAKKDIHHAVLLGASQEGIATLSINQDRAEHLYWQDDQSSQSQAGVWADSGEKFLRLIGAGVIEVSDTAPFLAGMAIKIRGVETDITSIHTAGAPGILVISPHIDGLKRNDLIEVKV